ncbi:MULTISPECIES: hypothetical protein [unclassified Streptomyces]|nr:MULTISPECIES: hypothetical protein [unclassified Streptomyces]
MKALLPARPRRFPLFLPVEPVTPADMRGTGFANDPEYLEVAW